MTTYRVSVTNPAHTAGVGPAEVEADSELDARDVFAAAEGTTSTDLHFAGLTEWTVESID